jgi:hypothetical protein
MRTGPKILLAVGLVATVIAVGFWLARIAQSPTTVTESPSDVDTESSPANTVSTASQGDTRRSASQPGQAQPNSPVAQQFNAETGIIGTNLMTDWEDRIDEVLRQDIEPAVVGKKLMEMLPQMPADGRIEALQHAANLISDEDYSPMGKMFCDPKTPEDEIEILMRDALNRPNTIKLPLLLEVARTAGHPKAGEAKEILEVFLGESYDNDWDKWQAKVNEFLKEDPETAALENR